MRNQAFRAHLRLSQKASQRSEDKLLTRQRWYSVGNSETRHTRACQLNANETLGMVEAGESEYLEVLKTRNLLIFRDAKNAEHGKIAPNWNVSGTRDCQSAVQICEEIT